MVISAGLAEMTHLGWAAKIQFSADPAEIGHEMLYGGNRVRVKIHLGWVGRDRRNVGSNGSCIKPCLMIGLYVFSAKEKGNRRRRKEGRRRRRRRKKKKKERKAKEAGRRM
jgi:hypothetical protein